MNSIVCVDKILDYTEQVLKPRYSKQIGQSLKQAFSKQITGNVNRIVKLHEICVDKIVENTEQPIKSIQSMQTGQFFETSI